MSEPLAERLSRFTPDGTSLDRDALLFAAGRASARPSRRWMSLAGVLAASQLLTLALLWPRPIPGPSLPSPDVGPAVAVQPPAPASRDASELLVLRGPALTAEGNLPLLSPMDRPAPSDPPLRAFAAPPAVLFD